MYQGVSFGSFRFTRQPSILFCLAAIVSAVFNNPASHHRFHIMASAKVSIAWPQAPASRITLSLFGVSPRPHYNWELSTAENYQSEDRNFCGRFKKIRQRLDYQYHANYSCARQLLQDSIIESMLNTTVVQGKDTARECTEPWIIFTAGVMGAGKTHTIRQLHANGQFPLESFVSVDPDEIRRLLPEFDVYIETCPERAGELTRKEAGMIAEILTEAALEHGQNVLVDGSMRDAAWYQNYFDALRHSFPTLKLGIIHITAPITAIFQRVKQRAKATGRVVPKDVLLKSIEQVPKSVEILRQHVDFFLEIHNAAEEDSASIVARGATSETVKENFKQKCAA